MFPIKYIEDNLVFNYDGECFAYYEMNPYNYSFLSPDQKMQVSARFRQLVAQSRNGKIHALVIGTESSVKTIQEKSKRGIKGDLKEFTEDLIDMQTEVFEEENQNGNQTDYRFFLGFKLMKNKEEQNLFTYLKEFQKALMEFIHSVNTELMGDFVVMDDAEVNRYRAMEGLLRTKISRRFTFRPLTKDDYGYILEYLYGQQEDAFEEFTYPMETWKFNRKTLVKKYDIIRPARCEIHENRRYFKLTTEKKEQYVSCFTVSSITSEMEFPSSELLYYQRQGLGFPVDVSLNVDIIPNFQAKKTVRNKKKELKDLDNHAYMSGNETSQNIIEALEDVDELEADLEATKDSMYKLSYVIRVTADSKERLQERCEIVRDYYDDANIKLVRPLGDMIGLHEEFLPSGKRFKNDYVQYVTSDFLSGLGFGASQILGEKDGIYIGDNLETGERVYVRPDLACQGVDGAVTNALAVAILGSLGWGKSMLFKLLMYYMTCRGGKALIVDPKGEYKKLKEHFPELAEEINAIEITNEKKNNGMLDPFVIMNTVEDGADLAKTILSFLLGIKQRTDGERYSTLSNAIDAVGKRDKRGLLFVIDELMKKGTETAITLAEYLNAIRSSHFGNLLFSDGTVERSINMENQLNIVSVEKLILPDQSTKLDDYTLDELLSISMLMVISSYALDFIHMERETYKMVGLDEAWTILQVPQGKALANKLVRQGRSMNAGVWFMTHNTVDLSDETMKNHIGLKFAFHSSDQDEIKKTLAFFHLDPEDIGNQDMIFNLGKGQCLMQDLYGRVGIVQIRVLFDYLFEGFDTRPPQEIEKDIISEDKSADRREWEPEHIESGLTEPVKMR